MVDFEKWSQFDLYKLLGVQPDSSKREIKKAYRKLALKCHPDKNPDGCSEKFKKLQQIIEILDHDELRKRYDQIFAKLRTLSKQI